MGDGEGHPLEAVYYLENESGRREDLMQGKPVTLGRLHTESKDVFVSRVQCRVTLLNVVKGVVSVEHLGSNTMYVKLEDDGVEMGLRAGRPIEMGLGGTLYLSAGKHPWVLKKRQRTLAAGLSRGQKVVNQVLPAPEMEGATLAEGGLDDDDVVEMPPRPLRRVQGGSAELPSTSLKKPRIQEPEPCAGAVDEASSESSVDEAFQCPVCYKLFEVPTEMLCCNRVFCHDCISQWLQRPNTSCPVCRVQVDSSFLRPNVAIARMISRQSIICKYCGSTTSRGSLKEHFHLCEKAPKQKTQLIPPHPQQQQQQQHDPSPHHELPQRERVPSSLEILLNMGFERAPSEAALLLVGGNAEVAATILLAQAWE